jgi:predicted house-cleaning noncanonical NTP pyrophosphatase (MazG superfamily)
MKLVRSRIPEIDRANGGNGVFRPVTDAAELDRLLDAKLDEELAEWRASGDPVELADLLSAVRAVALHRGIGWHQLVELAEGKDTISGGFLDGVVWEGPEDELRAARRAAVADALDAGGTP